MKKYFDSDSFAFTGNKNKNKNDKKEKTIWFCSFGCIRKQQCKHNTLFYSTLINISGKPLEMLVSSLHPSIKLLIKFPSTEISPIFSSLISSQFSSSPSSTPSIPPSTHLLHFFHLSKYPRLPVFIHSSFNNINNS
jgi:hypothetical protein